ncbi:MAG: response regulator [Gammaproteobacteria bacterium]|nr:response regulator [Gammaproteobacteria bacterium]
MKSFPTVYIVNPDTIVNSLTNRLLSSVNIFSRDFEAPSELLHNLPLSSPSCVLISLFLPEMNGIELMMRLRKQGVHSPCIFASPKIDAELVVKAMNSGGYSFIKKPFDHMELIELVQSALEYDEKSSKYAQASLNYIRSRDKLTLREKDILDLLLKDLSAMKIATLLNISHRTVENHRNKIFIKFGINKTTELIRLFTIYDTLKNVQRAG